MNKRLEEENTDFEINDFFEDEDYEDSAKTDNDKETEDDFLETEDDETTEETFVSRGSELPDHDPEEEKPIAGTLLFTVLSARRMRQGRTIYNLNYINFLFFFS